MEQSPLTGNDKKKQEQLLITYTESDYTENDKTNPADWVDANRTPLPAETRTYELTGFKPENNAARFSFDEWSRNGFALLASAAEIPYEHTANNTAKEKRLIEHVRTLYRKNDLTGLSPLRTLESLALPGESYKLALTPGLIASVFKRKRTGQPDEDLLPNPAAPLLEGTGGDQGGYVAIDGNWWIPTGRVFYSDNPNHTAVSELPAAQAHFFLPRRYRDPFGHNAVVIYDGPADPNAPRYDLLVTTTRDALGNTVTAANDYRVLQPKLVTDPNRNRTEVRFDTLGMVAGTAVMGKSTETKGDSLAGFVSDLTSQQLQDFLADPLGNAALLLGQATTRIVYDLDRYLTTQQPVFAATLARETHVSDPVPPGGLKIQASFSYSDGFGREIQKKIQAEPGPIIQGGPAISPRWVGSGWTIFNNKGKPVRQYEPFFSATHGFEFGAQVGVSPILFYDPVERVVATLHANHTYEKVVFDPWQQVTWDVNDTVLGDPRTDADVRGYTAGYFASLLAGPPAPTWETWHALRQGRALGAEEKVASDKAATHADTPTAAHFDTLGRPFLTLADNGPDPAQPGQHLFFATRVELDIEGNQRAVRDAIEQAGDPHGRVVMRYVYDMLN